MYKIYKDLITGKNACIIRLSDNACIPFDPANTDYQQFKRLVSINEAQLEDADGVLMTSAQAQAYVATLP